MEALTSILAFFVMMVCLIIFAAHLGIRVMPNLNSFFLAIGKGFAIAFPPLFKVVLFCGKLLFKLSKRFAVHLTKSLERQPKAKPTMPIHRMAAVRKDRLCQFNI